MKDMQSLLSEIAEAKEEAERHMDWDPDDELEIEHDPEEERFWKTRWCVLDTVEAYLTGKTDSLRIGIWVENA